MIQVLRAPDSATSNSSRVPFSFGSESKHIPLACSIELTFACTIVKLNTNREADLLKEMFHILTSFIVTIVLNKKDASYLWIPEYQKLVCNQIHPKKSHLNLNTFLFS